MPEGAGVKKGDKGEKNIYLGGEWIRPFKQRMSSGHEHGIRLSRREQRACMHGVGRAKQVKR